VLLRLVAMRPDGMLTVPVGSVPDIDGDGSRDCFAGVHEPRGAAMYSTADGRLIWEVALEYPPRDIESAGDVDGDGTEDLWISAPLDVVQLHSGANGALLRVVTFPLSDQIFADFGAETARVPDLDRDGIDDLVVGAPLHDGGNDAPVHRDRGKICVYSTGTGQRLGSILGDFNESEMGMEMLAVPDVDGDGRPDLLFAAAKHAFTGDTNIEVAVYSSARVLE